MTTPVHAAVLLVAAVCVVLLLTTTAAAGASGEIGPFFVSTYTSLTTDCKVRSAAVCESKNEMLVLCRDDVYEMKLGNPETKKILTTSIGFEKVQKLVRNVLTRNNNCTFLFGDRSGRLFTLDYISYTVNVVAGSGTPGSGCIDGVGVNAELAWPSGLAFHPQQPFAILPDHDSHTLKRVDIPEYRITTVAGKCNVAGGLDAIGTQATFKNPLAVFFHSSEVFYVGGNSGTIRMVRVSDYKVSTVIGSVAESNLLVDGVGTNARVTCPFDFYMLSDGIHVLFTDFFNNVIRSFTIPDYIVTTVVGSKLGIAGSADGVDLDAQFDLPVYFYPFSDFLFVGDFNNEKVRIVTLPSVRVNVSTFAILPSNVEPMQVAQCGPIFILSDRAKGLYELTGSFTKNPMSLKLLKEDQKGFIDIKADPISSYSSMSSGSCTFFVTHGSGKIYRFQYPTNTLEIVVGANNGGCNSDGKGTGALLDTPCALVYHPSLKNICLLTDWSSHTVKRVNMIDFQVTNVIGACYQEGGKDGVGALARCSYPFALAFRSPSEFYFGGRYNGCTIRHVTFPGYEVTTVVGKYGEPGQQDGVGRSARLGYATSILFLKSDLFLFADHSAHVIRKVELPLYTVVTIGGTGKRGFADGIGSVFNQPCSFYLFERGESILITDTSNGRIRKIPAPPLPPRTRTSTPTHTHTETHTHIRTPSLSFSDTKTAVEIPSSSDTLTFSSSLNDSTESASLVSSPPHTPPLIDDNETDQRSTSHKPSATLTPFSSPLHSSSISVHDPEPEPRPPPLLSQERVMGSVVSETGGEAVHGLGVGSSAITGFSGMTSAISSSFRLSAMLGSVYCLFTELPDAPSWMEAVVFPLGDSSLKYFAGSAVCTASVLIVLCLLLQGISRVFAPFSHGKTLAQIIGACVAMALQVYLPSVTSIGTLLLMHGNGAEKGIGGGCLLVSFIVLGWIAVQLTVRFGAVAVTKARPGDNRLSDAKKALLRTEFENKTTPGNGLFVECFSLMFDACSDSSLLRSRLYFLEELVASMLIAIISGLRPSEGSCYATASAMLLVSLLHLVYLVVCRPYRTRLDFVFAIFFAVNQAFISVLCLVTIQTDSVLEALGLLAMLQNISMFIQMFAQCGWLYVLYERRQFRARAAATNGTSGSSENDDSNSTPMLQVPPQTSSSGSGGDGCSNNNKGGNIAAVVVPSSQPPPSLPSFPPQRNPLDVEDASL